MANVSFELLTELYSRLEKPEVNLLTRDISSLRVVTQSEKFENEIWRKKLSHRFSVDNTDIEIKDWRLPYLIFERRGVEHAIESAIELESFETLKLVFLNPQLEVSFEKAIHDAIMDKSDKLVGILIADDRAKAQIEAIKYSDSWSPLCELAKSGDYDTITERVLYYNLTNIEDIECAMKKALFYGRGEMIRILIKHVRNKSEYLLSATKQNDWFLVVQMLSGEKGFSQDDIKKAVAMTTDDDIKYALENYARKKI